MKRALIVALLLVGFGPGGCATAVMGTSGGDPRSASQVAADTAISADVKAKLLAEPSLKPLSISVLTNLGQVTLAGFVNTAAQRDLAGRIAREVKGVKGIRNELTVK